MAISHAPVAQWIEHWSSEPGVGGSTPFRRTSHSFGVNTSIEKS